MKKGIRARVVLIVIVVILSFVYFLPSTPLYQGMPQWWKRFMPGKGITLGLDLQGGVHLVLQVEEEQAVENQVERTVTGIKDLFADKKIAGGAKRSAPRAITVTYTAQSEQERETILKEIKGTFPGIDNTDRREGELIYTLKEADADRIRTSAISQALETIRNRIDQFGVTEPLIQKQGADQILIQLPGVKDPQRAIDLIGKTALLEFKLLDETSPVASQLTSSIPATTEELWLKEMAGKIPEGDQILFERVVDQESGRVNKRPYLVRARTLMAGDVITDARVNIGEFNAPYVSITFDGVGAQLFERITAANIKKRMAIVLDGSVYSAPVIQDRIAGGRAQITGSFTMREATDLALVLRAGALPAPVHIIQNLTVGPSLGQDSIEKGIRATLVAGLLVVLFMCVYYKLCGVIADLALVLNLVVLIGALAALNATLTLPGIAGIILTIGMGVDSNVLIFERIREELRQKKPVRLAVDNGYDKAFLTIVDSHITTLLTGAVLFLFGTGPIKGFAVTLCLGIAINLFTALVGTKVVFDVVNSRRKLERLSI